MRAAEPVAPLTFQLAEVPIEAPGPGEVQVRVGAVGICGSDLHAYSEGAVGGTPNAYPMVLGHEGSGTVEAVGEDVTTLRPGDDVVLSWAPSCGVCAASPAMNTRPAWQVSATAMRSAPSLSRSKPYQSPPTSFAVRQAEAIRLMDRAGWN